MKRKLPNIDQYADMMDRATKAEGVIKILREDRETLFKNLAALSPDHAFAVRQMREQSEARIRDYEASCEK